MSRRRPLLLPLLVLMGVLAAGAFAGTRMAQPPADPAAQAASTDDALLGPQQYANGPIRAPAAAGQLQLKLAATTDPVAVPFKVPPRAGLLFDLDTGEVLWRRNPERVLPIASVTKIMTALVAVDALKAGTKVPVTKEALAYTGSGVGVLPKGKWVGLSAMLHGLLLASGNDTAIAIAQKASGSVPAFVDDMNLRAEAMGLRCTRFASPSGIIDRGNHSCAADLAVLARAILDEPRLAPIVARREAVLPFPIKGGKLYLYNHNPLLKERYPGTLGIKTGYTDAAGKCLVAAVEHGGRRYGVVLLHSPDMAKQAKQLFGRAYRLQG